MRVLQYVAIFLGGYAFGMIGGELMLMWIRWRRERSHDRSAARKCQCGHLRCMHIQPSGVCVVEFCRCMQFVGEEDEELAELRRMIDVSEKGENRWP